ncbi:hypothetical protein DUNSADRAFT_17167 [Dunaliella salina]|uniref:Mitochondrial import inner membrane translocase subunit TIM23 n=1 Tax=Dunaliella salina TaxID=3046 RepID=A0ABQ7H0E0_DUNSA|nr:hypothetical protein DUNSADRAFT_17167 [Dunaliella salina]|eukprot:KAF5840323.1 hypothetical protein DUNSADRAFT_17167 [Dunaliella salina]
MSWFSRRSREQPANPPPEPEPNQPPTPPPSELRIDQPTSSYGPPTLNIPGLGTEAGGGLNLPSMSGGKLYDPYEGISAATIGRKQAFKLPERPEFVFEEEAAVRRRGWSENLQFYTGLGYLIGGGIGVAAGTYNYATVKPDIPLDTWKLKANRLLNNSGSLAKPFGNGCGIIGLYFASLESYLANALDLPDVPDAANTVAAGAISGALFRSPRGPRQAAAAAVVGAIGGGSIAALRTVFPSL